tara:strand:- start:920 stop:1150 length:231 start_codon:yes stop_codon:yes gene_type:complete
MDKLKTATYVAVLIASVMVIFSIGKSNTGQFTYECDVARQMSSVNLKLAYDNEGSSNYYIQRAEGYSDYYNAFCKP